MANSDNQFRFRVSDTVEVPLRGLMLRLRLMDGAASMKDLGVGRRLLVSSPAGDARELRIVAHAMTGGKPSQQRLDRVRELDVIVAEVDGAGPAVPVEIGWVASGPTEDRS